MLTKRLFAFLYHFLCFYIYGDTGSDSLGDSLGLSVNTIRKCIANRMYEELENSSASRDASYWPVTTLNLASVAKLLQFLLGACHIHQFDRSNSLLPDNADCLVDQNPRTMRVSRQYIKRTSWSSRGAQASLPFLPLLRAKLSRIYAFDASGFVKLLSRYALEGQSESFIDKRKIKRCRARKQKLKIDPRNSPRIPETFRVRV